MIINQSKKISIIMGVYNTPIKYLEQSIKSILDQSYQNFEFIIINDGSNLKTYSYLKKISVNNKKIILINNDKNIGLTKSLNIGLECASGDYIARMDSDDISKPDRLLKQVNYLEENENVAVVGTLAEKIGDESGILNFGWDVDNQDKLKLKMLFGNYGLIHPSVLIRKGFLDDYNIKYRDEMIKSQDYGLWLDILNSGGQLACLMEPLLEYRVHTGQISSFTEDQLIYVREARENQLKTVIDTKEINLDYFHAFAEHKANIDFNFLRWYKDFKNKMIVSSHFSKNHIQSLFSEKLLLNIRTFKGKIPLKLLIEIVKELKIIVIVDLLLYRIKNKKKLVRAIQRK